MKRIKGFRPAAAAIASVGRDQIQSMANTDFLQLVTELTAVGIPTKLLDRLKLLHFLAPRERVCRLLEATLWRMVRPSGRLPADLLSDNEYRLLSALHQHNVADTLKDRVHRALMIEARHELYTFLSPFIDDLPLHRSSIHEQDQQDHGDPDRQPEQVVL